jgi:hypothetical protein
METMLIMGGGAVVIGIVCLLHIRYEDKKYGK